MELAVILVRPVAAVWLLLWATSVVPQLAAIAVAAAVAAFAAPVALASWHAGLGGLELPRAVSVELVRGASLGLAAAGPLWAATTAGRWAGDRWRGGAGASPMSSLYLAMVGVAFIAVDGPVLVCAAIVHSYATAPVGAPLLAAGWSVTELVGWWSTAVRLALPIVLTLAIAELAAAAAARAAAAVAVAWPSSALAPAVTLLITAPLVPLLLAALAEAVRSGLAS